jgi:predicted transcriptional regulator
MGSLQSSIILMHAIQRNKSRASINATFNGDVQLVDMLLSYLLHNHCIERESNSKSEWTVTLKGTKWISQYSYTVVRAEFSNYSLSSHHAGSH